MLCTFNMHTLCFILLLSFFLPATTATPLRSLFQSPNSESRSLTRLEKRQATFYPITGVPLNGTNGSGPVPRLEVRQLQGNADQWNLYLLGLDRLMNVDQGDKLSYYQISGIHGRPYIAWDGSTDGPGGTGYCTHASPLFGTWHRPYVALYEQVLYNIIQDIARSFPQGPDQDRYVSAASTFRVPYWDWAAAAPSGQSILPPSVGDSATVSVNTPTGPRTIHNPLYSYRFHPLDTNQLPNRPFSFWQETLRYPTSTNNPGATSRNNLVAQQLDNNRLTLRDRLYNLFTSIADYNQVSNKAWFPNDGGSYDSFESVHDAIHGLTGSGGHMGVVDYSAFDPLFWLHHTMIDRVFAIWQGLYPDSYLAPTVAPFGTWSTPGGTTVDDQYPLAPFHNDAQGNYWTSASARDTVSFGYTYPELLSADLVSAVNDLYGQTAPANTIQKRELHSPIPPGHRTSPVGKMAKRADKVDPKKGGAPPSVTTGDKYTEWITNIKVDKLAAGGTFFVHIFVGKYDSNPFSWSFEPNLVGSHCVFVQSSPGANDAQAAGANLPVSGSIPLTGALLDKVKAGSLKSLNTEDVVPYLQENLFWALSDTSDAAIPTDQVRSLVVSVVSSKVTKPANSGSFPKWGPYESHKDITADKVGGR